MKTAPGESQGSEVPKEIDEIGGRDVPSATDGGSGEEWIIDARGCRPAALADEATLRAVFARVIEELGLQPIGAPLWHKFPGPGGVTGLWLLQESHLCCHTFPETGYAAFNLYCCRPRPAWAWALRLYELLGAVAVDVRRLPRGGLRPQPGEPA